MQTAMSFEKRKFADDLKALNDEAEGLRQEKASLEKKVSQETRGKNQVKEELQLLREKYDLLKIQSQKRTQANVQQENLADENKKLAAQNEKL